MVWLQVPGRLYLPDKLVKPFAHVGKRRIVFFLEELLQAAQQQQQQKQVHRE